MTWPVRVWGFTGGSNSENLPAKGRDLPGYSCLENLLTEELCGLQSMEGENWTGLATTTVRALSNETLGKKCLSNLTFSKL